MKDSASLVQSIFDVKPSIRYVFMRPESATVKGGARVTYTIDVGRDPVRDPAVWMAALRSERFGDLLDPRNAAVVDNTCPAAMEAGAPRSCTFSVIAPKGVEAIDDQLTAELTDHTGPRLVISAETHVTVLPAPTTALTWAKDGAPWPTVRIGKATLTRKTTPAAVFPLRKCGSVVPDTVGDLLKQPVPERGRCVREWRLAKAAVVTLLNEAADSTYPAPAQEKILAGTAQALSNGPRSAKLAQRYEGWIAAVK